MKKNTRTLFSKLLVAVFLMIAFISCKKNIDQPAPQAPGGATQLSDADSLKYLMYNLMQVTIAGDGRNTKVDLPSYYWYQQVPKLDPLSSSYADAKALLTTMKTYPKDAQGQPLDKYSFLDNGQVADEIEGGVAGDIGMQVSYAYDANNNIVLVVLYADKNSPAGLAHVQRGWTITAINGQSVAYDGSDGPNVRRVINAVYYDPQATFSFQKPDQSIENITLAKSQYQINPVLFDTVYNVSGRKVGYFVFNTFSNVSHNGLPTLTKQELDRVFTNFKNNQITSLIVDLRYNGGGSVATAEYLDSLIAPNTVAGKEMYRYLYNDKLTANRANRGLSDKIFFKNGGGLNLQKVFFIGSDGTASASELTINNLRPYMDVKLVGDTTYGKPVGFFSFNISVYHNGIEKNLADLYAINFETRNALNQGGYFHGMIPDALAADFVGVPWGDVRDDHLDKIFNYISTGSYGRMTARQKMDNDKTLKKSMPETIHPLRFNGMVDKRSSQILQKQIDERLRNQ